MIVVIKKDQEQKQVRNLVNWIEGLGLKVNMSEGANSTVIGLVGD
ncbi:MAG: 3-deoxy-7-phosphoheptulonate synthase, partial [Clostridia bacterium]|nr:3-deoxy-7-phosphoheptulonate synthase [Clostridia bacterium]